MPKIVTEADRQQKRLAILDAAAAEIARYGYDRANINTIAEHAGIGRGTIYLYFDSKDDVFSALLDTIGKAILTESSRSALPCMFRGRRDCNGWQRNLFLWLSTMAITFECSSARCMVSTAISARPWRVG